jgi:hypothetical protein
MATFGRNIYLERCSWLVYCIFAGGDKLIEPIEQYLFGTRLFKDVVGKPDSE